MRNTYEIDVKPVRLPLRSYTAVRHPLDDTEVVYIGTPVKLVAGEVTPCAATDAVYGFSLQPMTGDGETVLPVEVVTESEYEIVSNADITTADIGVSFRFAIASDRYLLDKTGGAQTGANAVMVVVRVEAPRLAVVRFVKNQLGLAGPQGPQGA